MPRGTLEVLLVNAKDLENMDFLCKMDPYCIITCRSQEQKSSIAKGQGSEPKWNETFKFNIYEEDPEDLEIKIMDSDLTSSDDFVGEVSIPLDILFETGEIPAKDYNVILDKKYKGSIKIALTFISEDSGEERGESYDDQDSYAQKRRGHANRESLGGEEDDDMTESYGRRGRGYGGDTESSEPEEMGYGGNSKSYGREEKGYGGSKQSYGHEERSYGGDTESYGQEEKGYGGNAAPYGRQQKSYGGGDTESYGEEEKSYGGNAASYGRQERSYGGDTESLEQEESGYTGNRGSSRQEEKGYGGHTESSGREERGYGANRESSGREGRGYGDTRESPVQGRRGYGGRRGSDDED